ncbi:hypothetical protein NE237_026937 [Protea cynaroides]|uniref:Amino acid transporter transmembrane domain-containing protein n=1 Tax=Protea cynaroides TaxID=273540 RepID=A0A9Q0JTR1_9MAGN|nr:hypothetical protein NE237_026937 [Protea cynaroides]
MVTVEEHRSLCNLRRISELTVVTASAHISSAVIGSGVLSLAWVMAHLGWVAGPAVLMAFSVIIWFTSTLLVDGYRDQEARTLMNEISALGIGSVWEPHRN